MPHILTVNPWIHDFAAYDFWAAPLGLLTLVAILRRSGFAVSYINCLDRFHHRAAPSDPTSRSGRGPYLKTPIPRPVGLADVPRRYARYGILPSWLESDLRRLRPPELVLVTGIMSYWAGGVAETIEAVRRVWPQAVVILGGIYASLWPDHARRGSGADIVTQGRAESTLLGLVERLTGFRGAACFDPQELDSYPWPAHDLQERFGYVPLLTARGCPFECAYCAARILNPSPLRRGWASVVEEVLYWQKDFGIRDFVFYDDALLADAPTHALPLLEALAGKGLPLRLHAPNALHLRFVTAEIAGLMYRCGFETVRLGLETAAEGSQRPDNKVARGEFERAVGHLKAAGFRGRQIGVYLLAGLPDQNLDELEASIAAVKAAGAVPILAHYTPIPGTGLWEKAKAASRYDLEADPVFTNNAVWPCRKEPFNWQRLSRLKRLTRHGQ